MTLEAVWLKNKKEVYKVSPVMNLVCYEDMESIAEIEVEDEERWHTYDDVKGGADDFVIRVKRS
jgi:hypothetical protein